VPFGQHDHDKRIGHDGYQQQERHDEPVHGSRVPYRHLCGHVQVAFGVVSAVRSAVEIEQVSGHHGRVVFLVHRSLTIRRPAFLPALPVCRTTSAPVAAAAETNRDGSSTTGRWRLLLLLR